MDNEPVRAEFILLLAECTHSLIANDTKIARVEKRDASCIVLTNKVMKWHIEESVCVKSAPSASNVSLSRQKKYVCVSK